MAVEVFGPFNFQSGKVSKKALESTGKTAHRAQWFDAPNDRYFVEDSWHVDIISAKGKNAGITINDFKKTGVDVTLPNGETVTHQFVTSFYAVAHAETGSGKSLSDITAWVEGNVSAETQEFS